VPAVFTAVVLLVGISALGDAPDTRNSTEQIARYFSVHNNSIYFCAVCVTVAMGGLLVFAAFVAQTIDGAGASVLASVARSTSVVVATGVIIAMALMYATLAYVIGPESPGSAKALFELTLVVVPLLAVPIGMLIGVVALAVFRNGVGRPWFGVLSIVAVVVCAIGACGFAEHGLFSPDVQQQVVFQVLIVWLIASVWGLRERRAYSEATVGT